MIILGLALSAGASGVTIAGMFWMLTVARGITGFGTGGEYPGSYLASTPLPRHCDKAARKSVTCTV